MLKESDLIEGHKYVSDKIKIVNGVMNKREIFKLYCDEGLVTYCELKGRKNGILATMKTVSIKAFLKWAKLDVTPKEDKQNGK
ncbi:hypothetical protein [Mannheimia indoligenes]|uniref:hypothetical protein n=1 Tax=Mannheimia indoligenes TaxID=3103145 RepID=UPI002FE64019